MEVVDLTHSFNQLDLLHELCPIEIIRGRIEKDVEDLLGGLERETDGNDHKN